MPIQIYWKFYHKKKWKISDKKRRYVFFIFLLKNIDCGYSLEPPRQAVLMSTNNLCFEQK